MVEIEQETGRQDCIKYRMHQVRPYSDKMWIGKKVVGFQQLQSRVHDDVRNFIVYGEKLHEYKFLVVLTKVHEKEIAVSNLVSRTDVMLLRNLRINSRNSVLKRFVK